MDAIPTLTGTISPDDLGIVAFSENLLFGMHGWQWDPAFTFDRAAAFQQVRAALEKFKELGGNTLVDTTGITLGRNVPFYTKLARITGVQIIAATGFESQEVSIPGHFLGRAYRATTDSQQHWQRKVPGYFYPSHGESKEYLMFLFFNELTEGMASPGMVLSEQKAALIKTGCGWDEITGLEEFSIRGAAMAARKTGAAVLAVGINQISQQIELMMDEGLAADRIVVSHCDDARAMDVERDKALAGQGCYVAYDHVGWQEGSAPHGVSDDRRLDLIQEMISAGLTDRIVVSCGAIGYPLGGKPSPHSFEHLLANFVPRMKQSGIADSDVQRILVDNPRRILAGA